MNSDKKAKVRRGEYVGGNRFNSGIGGFNATILMRGLVTAILVISVLAMFTAVASATDYYVRTGGNDDNDGTADDDHAWATINKGTCGSSPLVSGDILHAADVSAVKLYLDGGL